MLKLCAILLTYCLAADSVFAADAPQAVDSGNTAWLLICAALVMLMTPGLAFFYAGMVNRKNVVSTLLQNYVALAVVGLIWVIVGYSLAFSEGNSFIGGFDLVMLKGLENKTYLDTGVPMLAFVAFQMMFAAITPALITGSVAERVNFSAWILMMALWSIVVYAPVAHWVWGPNGWIAADGGLDFAGGLVVHITAGVAGLICAKTFGRRINADDVNHPNDISMIMLGGALLWFGWFGFNAGSAISSGHLAAHSFMTTYVGASASFIAWMMYDWLKHKRPSAVGATIGLVVGLVTITPAAGYVSIQSAIIMCFIAGLYCNMFTTMMKTKTKLDDALDVFACHGMGGILGAVMTGLFAETAINPAVVHQGFFIDGDLTLFVANLKGVIVVSLYTAVATYGLIKFVNLIIPIRISQENEEHGLDKAIHGELVNPYVK
jgi:ammonium transporter, Amt family